METRLIDDTLLQLVEHLRRKYRTLLLPSAYPRSDMLEIFKRDLTLRVFASQDQPFSDRIVCMRGKVALQACPSSAGWRVSSDGDSGPA